MVEVSHPRQAIHGPALRQIHNGPYDNIKWQPPSLDHIPTGRLKNPREIDRKVIPEIVSLVRGLTVTWSMCCTWTVAVDQRLT